MIKAVIFDLGSVLVKGPWKVAYRNIAKETKMSLEKSIAIIQPIRDKWSGAKINEQQFWMEIERKIGKKLSLSFRKNLWYDTYLKKRRDVESVWKIAAKIKKNGYGIAILSNTTPPSVKANKISGRLKRLRDLGFNPIILSCEVKCRKPEPKIYKITLKRLKLKAKECVFIDDRIDNIRAAKKLGIKSIHFENPQQLRKDLVRLKLL